MRKLDATSVPGIYRSERGYLVRLRWTCPKTGRRKEQLKTCKTMAEAAAVKLAGPDLSKGCGRLRLQDYATEWLTMHSARLQPSARGRYEVELGSALAVLGNHYIDAIDGADVRGYVAELTRAGYASASINGRLRILRQVLADAQSDGLCDRNAAKAVRQLRERPTSQRRLRALSAAEFAAFVKEARLAGQRRRSNRPPALVLSPDVSRMVLAAAWTGARRGELCALRWKDYSNGELRLSRSVTGRHEGLTKSEMPRVVAVPVPLAEILAEQRQWLLQRQHPALPTGLMFPAEPSRVKAQARRRGLELSWYRAGTALRNAVIKVGQAIGVELTTHALRRTYEQLMRRAGVDAIVRRSVAGWARADTQAIYAAVDSAERQAAADAMVKLVSK